MKIHIIVHESFEAPAAMVTWAKACNHEISYTRFYLHESLPKSSEGFDFLIVMGGTQSPGTTTEECEHFSASNEINLIKLFISNQKLVLGVCLGAQLVGEAMGAKSEHSPHKEIGVFPLNLTKDGKIDSIFKEFPVKFSWSLAW
jgi:GMP synthase (glutamine-hydrolysing)